MKKLLKSAWVVLTLTLVLTACTETDVPKEPTIPVVTGESFTARYGVPLTTGRPMGEQEIVDSAHAAATNVAELKPVITKIIQDALDGKLATHPDGDEPKDQDPKTHLQRVVANMAADGRPEPKLEDMTISMEVNYDGIAKKGSAELSPVSLDLIWVDPTETLPDFLLGRIWMKDLAAYNVQQGSNSIPLATYLQSRTFENYVINVAAGDKTHFIKNFTESTNVQQLLDQGNLAEIMNR
ncbi:MAG: hypothetical protein RLZZ519_387 [Bacteroidota bacterium]|jgi:hypothetical protein